MTPTAALVDRLHAALGDYYAGGDDRALRDVLTGDVAWHVPGRNAIAGDYRGRDEVLSYFDRRRRHAAGTLRLHPGDVMVGERHVAVVTDGTATLRGAERRWSTVGLYRVREGRVAECWLLPLDAGAFDAAWR